MVVVIVCVREAIYRFETNIWIRRKKWHCRISGGVGIGGIRNRFTMYNLAVRTRDLEIVKDAKEVRFDKLSDKSKRNSLRLLVQCELERRHSSIIR